MKIYLNITKNGKNACFTHVYFQKFALDCFKFILDNYYVGNYF